MAKKKQNLVSVSQYVKLVRATKEGKDCTPQTLHQRKNRGAIEFVIGGDTPGYKIDLNKYPPDKYKKEVPGPKN